MSISLTFSERREFSVYTATDRKLTVYCGDVLKFLPSVAGQFDAIWDRSAIIAINVECEFFLAVVEQLYRMRHRGIPAALQKSHARLYENNRDRFAAFSQRSVAARKYL